MVFTRVFVLFLFICPSVLASFDTSTEISNDVPQAIFMQTYSRYGDADDNFPVNNFTQCTGEDNRTVILKFVVQDRNSAVEVLSGGNVSFRLFYMDEGVERNVPGFSSSYLEANLDSQLNLTQISYLENFTLEDLDNKTLFKVYINSTDVHGDSNLNHTFFTLHELSCLRVDDSPDIVYGVPYSLSNNYSSISIIVDENVTGRIFITTHDSNPLGDNLNNSLDKYITIDVEGTILQETVNLSFYVTYTDDEILDKGLNESLLDLYRFEDSGWVSQNSDLDEENNLLTLVLNENLLAGQSYRLGTYAIVSSTSSETPGTVITSPSSGGRSSSGGFSSGVTEGNSSIDGGSEDILELFDISFNIDETILKDARDLESLVSLDNFGDLPTNVSLTFKIFNEAGDLVYFEEKQIVVGTEEDLFWDYEKLAGLVPGKYNATLETLYAGDVYDLFSQSFEIVPETEYPLSYERDYRSIGFFLIFLLILFLIGVICGKCNEDKCNENKTESREKKKVELEEHGIFKKIRKEVGGLHYSRNV